MINHLAVCGKPTGLSVLPTARIVNALVMVKHPVAMVVEVPDCTAATVEAAPPSMLKSKCYGVS